MRSRLPSSTSPPEQGWIGRLFGLSEADHATLADARRRQIRIMATIYPFALAGQALAVAILTALKSGSPGVIDPSILWVGVPILLVGALALILVKTRLAGNLEPHLQMRAALVYAGALGAGQVFLMQEAIGLSHGLSRDAAMLSAGASTALWALAFLPARGALFSFAVTITALTFVTSGSWLAASVAAAFLSCFVAATFRLARHDIGEAARGAEGQREAMLATRLVRDFETGGTGWFWETDERGRLTYISEKVRREIDGDGDVVGRPLTQIFEMDGDAPDTERTLSFHLSGRTSFAEYSVRAVAGTEDRWWSISGRPFFDEMHRFRGFIGNGSDLTAKRRSEADITRLALFDGLTGLANRQRMRQSLDQSLAQPKGAYRPTALLLLDLDRFKAVNDTLGHQVGDELLKQVAQRLQRSVGDNGLVGRLGGDEFKIVVPGEGNREQLSRLADSVIAALSQPYAINGNSILIGCSVGIALSPDDGDCSETLIRNADLALYAAKAGGRGVHRFYRQEMLAEAHNRKLLEDDLRRAFSQGEFHLVYQPVVSTATAQIVGYEALLRWDHPTRGAVSPTDFIPIAEDCGLIEKIGEWVLRTACLESAHWPDGIRVGVNVSPIQFANPALPALVMSAISSAGIAPEQLELEITEGVFLHESASTDQMFAKLKSIGVRLALDDFGTGYSSLGYLKTAPFDKIKIDQSFVRGAAVPGSRNAAIIKAIVTLANTLGMETTAEGAEIQDEIALIRDLGCSHIQGFVYGRPMLAADVRAQLSVAGHKATASGHMTSRAPRTRMLRSASLEVDGRRRAVRIRSMSTSGAMIDEVGTLQPGAEVLIELLEGRMFRASVRWAKDGKAGLHFAEGFDTARLNAASAQRSIRRTA